MSLDTLKKTIEVPEWLPVLPVRNTVLFPNAAIPLIVGRSKSIKAVRSAQAESNLLLVVSQKDPSKDDPRSTDLNSIGVVCLISRVTQTEKESFQLIANGLFRFEVLEFSEKEGGEGFLIAKGRQRQDEKIVNVARVESLTAEIKELGKTILNLAAIPGSDALIKLFSQVDDPAQIGDLCSTFLQLSVSAKQGLLEEGNLEKRLETLLQQMIREREKLALQNEIQTKMMERLSKDQRDHLLREQMKTINEELGDDSGPQEDLSKKIEEAGMPDEVKKVAKEELNRLNLVQRSSPEYHVIRNYLDWLVVLPWKKESALPPAEIDLDGARKVLDEDHYGIDKVKKRILQFLAVTKLKKNTKGPILCLLGPPGVGKTSIAQSIARSLGRKFVRTSLGGVHDEAEIRGHRRTYIGSMPGRIIQGFKRAGVRDPLILLDEIDKVGADFRGDPASALLEVLDPEQNHTFIDHYLDVPFDVSSAFFITTANRIDTVPPALRDRLEVIEMTSYSRQEKLEIAKRHLVPKCLADHGIPIERVEFKDDALRFLIEAYTREAGVRQLTRELNQVSRSLAEDIARQSAPERISVDTPRVESIMGPRKHFEEVVNTGGIPGVVTGLAWTPVGGEILPIEVSRMDGKGNLILTGQLGDVMKESAQIALSLLRSHLSANSGIAFDKTDFHIHVPAGAIPKDGPSAGVAIFLALTSLVQNQSVSADVAVTGEITLRGTILPVGGIKEKVLAAHRAGVKTVCLPKKNAGDLQDVASEVKDQLTFHLLENISEVLDIVGLSKSPTALWQPVPSAFTCNQPQVSQ